MAETYQDEQADFAPQDQGNMGAEGSPTDLSLLENLQEQLKFQAQHRPYVTVAAAAAAGYVLGAGVPWWAVRAAVNIGSRMLVARVVASVVEEP